MIKTSVLVILIALRVIYQPSAAQEGISPFASQPTALSATQQIMPAKLIRFSGFSKNNKTVLEWVIDENETADLFEVEKSSDGKNYSLAAIVFGSDTPSTNSYSFYEKAGNSKLLYRVKIVNKNKTAVYTPVVEINPGA